MSGAIDTVLLGSGAANGSTFLRGDGVWAAGTSGSAACSVYSSGTFSHNSSGNYLAITFDSERYDAYGFHSTSSNTSRLTIPSGYDGVYLFNAFSVWDTNTSGVRDISIIHYNSSGTKQTAARTNRAATSGGTAQTISCVFKVVATDYIQVEAYQNSGGTRTLHNNGASENGFSCTQIA